MLLKGLPNSYKPFAVHVTQNTSAINFATFKSQLKSYEETKKFNTKTKTDQVMKADSPVAPLSNSLTCYGCGRKGHILKDCPDKRKEETAKWCSYHKSTTHSDSTCRRHQQKDKETTRVKQATSEDQSSDVENEHSFVFKVDNKHSQYKENAMLVDTGATSHIVTTDVLKRVDGEFNCLRWLVVCCWRRVWLRHCGHMLSRLLPTLEIGVITVELRVHHTIV